MRLSGTVTDLIVLLSLHSKNNTDNSTRTLYESMHYVRLLDLLFQLSARGPYFLDWAIDNSCYYSSIHSVLNEVCNSVIIKVNCIYYTYFTHTQYNLENVKLKAIVGPNTIRPR